MKEGRISNVFTVTLCNHVGTHIDGPNHFGKNKKPLNSFDINDFVFERPLVLDLPKEDAGLITTEDLKPFAKQLAKCDLLLIRTGFGKIRSQDSDRYAAQSPGFTERAAVYLRDNFENISTIGMDTLSFACLQHIEEGIRAHQVLMDETERDIFLIEDMNLDFDLSNLKKIIIAPLFFEKLDSAPCTILAEVG
jgi:kynurenine formamidase